MGILNLFIFSSINIILSDIQKALVDIFQYYIDSNSILDNTGENMIKELIKKNQIIRELVFYFSLLF